MARLEKERLERERLEFDGAMLLLSISSDPSTTSRATGHQPSAVSRQPLKPCGDGQRRWRRRRRRRRRLQGRVCEATKASRRSRRDSRPRVKASTAPEVLGAAGVTASCWHATPRDVQLEHGKTRLQRSLRTRHRVHEIGRCLGWRPILKEDFPWRFGTGLGELLSLGQRTVVIGRSCKSTIYRGRASAPSLASEPGVLKGRLPPKGQEAAESSARVFIPAT